MAADERAGVGQQRGGVFLDREHPGGQHEQSVAKLGQGDAAPAALEQAHAIGILQRLDLGGKRRLRDPERAGGAREAAFPSDQVEGAELREIHRFTLYYISIISI